MEHEGNKNKRRETGGNYYFIGRPEHIVLSLVTGDSKTANDERRTRRARVMRIDRKRAALGDKGLSPGTGSRAIDH